MNRRIRKVISDYVLYCCCVMQCLAMMQPIVCHFGCDMECAAVQIMEANISMGHLRVKDVI
jgi:hypothetical protein